MRFRFLFCECVFSMHPKAKKIYLFLVLIGKPVLEQHLATVVAAERKSHLRADGTNGIDVKNEGAKEIM